MKPDETHFPLYVSHCHRSQVKSIFLMLQNKWKDMFPNIVTKARTIEVLDTGSLGGLLYLVRTSNPYCTFLSLQ